MMDSLILKAYAAAPGMDAAGSTSLNELITKVMDNIVNPIVYLIIALAVVYFVWGVLVFIQNADDPEKRAQGYKHMIWGIIGLFIILSAKGIVNVITSTIGAKSI